MQTGVGCRLAGPSFRKDPLRRRPRLSPPSASDSGRLGTLRFSSNKPESSKGRGPITGDKSLVFVAGSTGRLGLRVVRELLQEGYSVRAGCRDGNKAEEYISAARSFNLLTNDELARLSVVEFDLESPDTLPLAIGRAATVVCCVGAPESQILDVQAPYRIDGEGSISLIEQGQRQGSVDCFVLVTSLGTEKLGWPAGILNLFWGVLVWKRKAEQALMNSRIPNWTIVRPGGMERPTDSYSETNATRLFRKNTQFGGQVSRLQVAKVVAACVANKESSARKIIEVVTEQGGETRALDAMIEDIEPEPPGKVPAASE